MSATVSVEAARADYTWSGAAGGSWTTATNWTPNGIPGTNPLDTATIADGDDPVLDQATTIASLTLSGGSGRAGTGTLTVTGGDVAWAAAEFAGSGTTILGPAAKVTLGGPVTLGGTAELHNGGALSFAGGGLAGAGQLENLATGTITQDAVGQTTIAAPFANAGAVVAPFGKGTLSFGSYVQSAGTTTVGGALEVTGGPLTLAGGALRGAGTVTGAVANNGGTVGPGASPGTLTIAGAYTQAAGGTLESRAGVGVELRPAARHGCGEPRRRAHRRRGVHATARRRLHGGHRRRRPHRDLRLSV